MTDSTGKAFLPAVIAAGAPARSKPSNYPAPFAARMAGRVKRPLGDLFGLRNFGVNLTLLRPGAVSALHHVHSRQDEFIYVVEGEPTLLTDHGETHLRPGMVAGFAAGGTPHHLENRTDRDCVILEIGDRTPGTAQATLTMTSRRYWGRMEPGTSRARTERPGDAAPMAAEDILKSSRRYHCFAEQGAAHRLSL